MTRKIYLVTCNLMPNVFMKAESEGEALKKFSFGMSEREVQRRTEDRSFRVRELTMELLMEVSPDEFLLTEDAGF